MNEYEVKQEARRRRYLDRADSARNESNSAFKRSHDAVSMIPMGQPILLGHHSESRHRAALKQSDNAMRKSIDADKKSKHYQSKAAGVGHDGVSSDDPDAIVKLQAKIDSAEALQIAMKTINKIVKSKRLTDDEKRDQLSDFNGHDYTDALEPDFCGRVGMAPYQLQNNNANIRRMKDRIAQLRATAERETVEESHGDIQYIENADIGRVQLIFPGKPDSETRTLLKSRGFRWAPSEEAWQRHLNNGGIYAAKAILQIIEE